VITLEAINAATGDSLAQVQEQAASKEQVFERSGFGCRQAARQAGRVAGLGSRSSTSPCRRLPLSSLEALKAFTQADELRERGDALPPVALYQRAIELDPNFAMAYARLGTQYFTVGQADLARQNYQKAFELRERASERENSTSLKNITMARASWSRPSRRWSFTPKPIPAIGRHASIYRSLTKYSATLTKA